jgi:hypothetical protein
VPCLLEAKIAKPAEAAVARQWLSSDYVVTPIDKDTIIEDGVFYAIRAGAA